MAPQKKRNVVPEDQAVFWMDNDGVWHNEHGRLEHPKIVNYFNQCIEKDDQGYFLCQDLGDVEEKVYFPYKETAVFVVNFEKKKDVIELVLNIPDTIFLDPEALYIKEDALFMETRVHLVKFSQKALARMTPYLKSSPQGLMFNLGRKQTLIREK